MHIARLLWAEVGFRSGEGCKPRLPGLATDSGVFVGRNHSTGKHKRKQNVGNCCSLSQNEAKMRSITVLVDL